MAEFFRTSLPLGPEVQDDHYLMYRLCDYIEADQINKIASSSPPSSPLSLPFSQKGAKTVHFPMAGMYVRNHQNTILSVIYSEVGPISYIDYQIKNC